MKPKRNALGFIVLMASLTMNGYANGLCDGPQIGLEYIKKNFDALYAKSYDQLWQRLHEAKDAAIKCDSIDATAEFLGLVSVGKGNAEFEEFFAETMEQVCVEHPQCFMKAASQVKSSTRAVLKQKLEKPLFQDRADIDIDRCLPTTKKRRGPDK